MSAEFTPSQNDLAAALGGTAVAEGAEAREDVGGRTAAPSPTPRKQRQPKREEAVERPANRTPAQQRKAPVAEAMEQESDDAIYDQLAGKASSPGTGDKGERVGKTQNSPSRPSAPASEGTDDDAAGVLEEDDRGQGEGEGEASEGGEQDEAGEAEEEGAAAYELSDEDREMLRRTGREMPKHAWERLSAAEQEAWVEQSYEIRRNLDRAFQRQQQQQQEDDAEVGGSRSDRSTRTSKLPKVLQQHIDKIRDWDGGLEELSGPIGEAFGTIITGTRQAMGQLQQRNEALEKQVSFLAGLISARDSSNAWKVIEKEFPGTRGVKFKNVRAEVEQIATTLLNKRYAKGDYSKSFEDLILEAARGRFFDKDKIEQRTVERLAKARKESLAGVSERADRRAPAVTKKGDIYDEAYDALEKGVAPEELQRM